MSYICMLANENGIAAAGDSRLTLAPIPMHLNRIMGFLLGAVCGILNVWAVSLVIKALVPVLGALFPQLFRAELFENSMLFNLIYEFNPFVYLGMDWLGL